MLRSVKELYGYNILAKDGEVGNVHDLYFDDVTWSLRYLIVDIGGWLPGRRVMISPVALEQPDWSAKALPVILTKEQIKNSPDIDLNKPVSRQKELELLTYYDWPIYWTDPNAHVFGLPKGVTKPEETAEEAQQTQDPHLRSSKEVTGYHIKATDGEVGHVEDFIIDDETWHFRYLAVDTRNWLPGKKVLVSPQWIEQVNWAESNVEVDLARETIKNSPEFDPSEPVNREYELRLYDYYGRPKYWS